MTISRLLARPMLASMFVVGGASALQNAEARAKAAAPVTEKLVPLVERAMPNVSIPSEPVTLVRINAAAQVAAGLALATGRVPRLSALVLAASLLPTTAAGHRYWEEDDPTQRANQKIHFFKNVSMMGGLVIASFDTEGRPGMAWRARRAARDARREAGHLATSARREAKLAAAQIG